MSSNYIVVFEANPYILVFGGGPQGPVGPAGSGGSGTDPEFDSMTITAPGGMTFKMTIVGVLSTGAPDIQWERLT